MLHLVSDGSELVISASLVCAKMPRMDKTKHQGSATAMLERARRILELTLQDWRLHEQAERKRKGKQRGPQGETAYKGGLLNDTESILIQLKRNR